jgi:peptide-methionine (S)-S-oxide reductase
MKEIVLGGGCFWGVQEYYRRTKGILESKVGYAQGTKENPSYQEVCSGFTHHAEVVYLQYDESVISLSKILEHLFRMIDPTSLNKQCGDIGTQYRTGVYFIDDSDEPVIRDYLAQQQPKYKKPIVVEVSKLKKFYNAEDYHQLYLVKNPTGYCHINMGLLKPEERKDVF